MDPNVDPSKLPMPAGFPPGGFDRVAPPLVSRPVGQDEIDNGSLAAERPSLLGAAFRSENVIGSAIASKAFSIPNDLDPTFDGWARTKGNPDLEERWDKLSTALNPARYEAMVQDIRREAEDRKALDASPWRGGAARGLASFADVTTFLPGGAFVRGGRLGYSAGRSAFAVGGAAGAGTAVQEGALQATQQTRSMTESAVAVGGSVILGGLLGGAGAHMLTNSEWHRLSDIAKKAEEVLGPNPEVDAKLAEFGAGAREAANTNMPLADAGAAATPTPQLDDLTLSGKAARAVGAATSWMNPGLRLITSPSAETRATAEKLLKGTTYLNMHGEGRTMGVAAETAMIEHMGRASRSVAAMDEIYQEARKAGLALAPEEFRRVVGRAMRRDDTASLDDPGLWAPVKRLANETDEAFRARIERAVEPVSKAAKAWRETLIEPLKQDAIAQKLLDPDVSVDTAASYFSRVWQREKLVAREGEAKAIFRQHLAREIEKSAQAFDGAQGRRLTNLQREIDDLEMAKLRREEELRQREQDGGEVSSDMVSEGDIRQAIRLIEGGGGPKPNVQTLTQFIAKNGGLVDDQGELAYRGITAKVRPGFVRSEPRSQFKGGGWNLDDMAGHAWESGYFPEHTARPSIDEFLAALEDDFFKHRPVVKLEDRDAYRIRETIKHIEADLSRMGINPASPRFSTSEEMKGVVARVAQGLNEDANRKIVALRARVGELERESRLKRLEKFGDPDGKDFEEAVESAVENVFATLVGRSTDTSANGYRVPIAKQGPLKERTFNIPDHLVEDFLEDDVVSVGRRYARTVGADVELARNFQGDPTLKKAIDAIKADYEKLRAALTAQPSGRRDIETTVKEIGPQSYLIQAAGAKGDLSVSIKDGYARVGLVGVSKSNRGQGLGTALYERALDFAAEQGLPLRSDVSVTNAAVKIYERMRSSGYDVKLNPDAVKTDKGYSGIGRGNYVFEVQPKAQGRNSIGASTSSDIEKQLRALDKRQRADIGDLEAMRDQLRGTVRSSHTEQSFDRVVKVANQMNYIRLMGGIVVGNLSDLARVPMVHGMQALGFGPLARVLGSNLKKEAIKLSIKEAQLAGNVLERLNDSKMASMMDLTNPYTTQSPVEAFMDKATDLASKWNGIRKFTDLTKGWTSIVTQNRILDGVSRYAELPDSERRYLAFLGINESTAQRIARQAETHGNVTEGVRVAGSANWDDDAARRAFYGAVNKDVDSINVQQSVGDIPLLATTPLGRLVFQFKRYTLAANQRVLMRGLQEDQARFWGGLTAATSIGMIITYLKAVEGNRTDQLSDNPGYWLAEGLDRSGVPSMLFEISNTAEKLGLYGIKKGMIDAGEGIFPGVSGKEGPSRYGARGKMGSLFGPSVGLGEDIATVLSIPESLAREGKVTDQQTTAAKNIVPYGSFHGVKQFLNYVVLPPN